MATANPATLSELRKQWRKDPAFVSEYAALEDEFALAESVIKARAKSGLTQAQLAERMQCGGRE